MQNNDFNMDEWKRTSLSYFQRYLSTIKKDPEKYDLMKKRMDEFSSLL